ncbi:MAG: hypothetical protein P4M11_14100 [Candidatus Pacebacteria bacterium]|nr:hypothetical protein [Candidatus Paceibacterota bacterium]
MGGEVVVDEAHSNVRMGFGAFLRVFRKIWWLGLSLSLVSLLPSITPAQRYITSSTRFSRRSPTGRSDVFTTTSVPTSSTST